MNRKKLWAALTALACLGVAIGLGWADNNVFDHGTYFSNVPTGLKTTSTGELYTSESAKDRDNWRVYPNVINNQLNSTTAGVDSSQALDIHDMRKLWLVLYTQFDSLSSVVRVAVQVRAHYNTASDSGSTYPWIRWPVPKPAVPISVPTLVAPSGGTVLHAIATAAGVGACTPVPLGYQVVGPGVLPGTYVTVRGDSNVTISAATATTFAPATFTFYPPGSLLPGNFSNADSIGDVITGIGPVAQATEANTQNGTLGMWPGEFMVKFNYPAVNDSTAAGTGHYGAYPKGMWIPLQDYQGVPFQAPYMSIRVRVINGVRSRFRVRADIVGSSL